MRIIMVIGGIGSGKSSVCKLLASRGAHVIDLDLLGHEVLEYPEVMTALAEEFGDQVIERGKVNRAALASAGFASSQASAMLSKITHPSIVQLALDRIAVLEKQDCPAVVIEASAFNGPNGSLRELLNVCCGIVAVSAPCDLRLQRAASGRFSKQDVRSRIARQPSDDQRSAWADFEIVNDGTLEDLDVQVSRVWQKYFA